MCDADTVKFVAVVVGATVCFVVYCWAMLR